MRPGVKALLSSPRRLEWRGGSSVSIGSVTSPPPIARDEKRA
jgi:hypothetical protein